MAFYWRLKSMPELRELPRPLRRQWWREAVAQSRTWRDRVLLALGIVGSLAAGGALARALHWNGPEHLLAVVVLAGGFGCLLEASIQPRARRWLQNHLDAAGSMRPRSAR